MFLVFGSQACSGPGFLAVCSNADMRPLGERSESADGHRVAANLKHEMVDETHPLPGVDVAVARLAFFR
jgi:hypothetical protein